MAHLISPFDATLLGMVEGLTEFLPVSSTGHLILTSAWLGLNSEDPATKAGVDAFEIVIQSGALLAVVGMYRETIGTMIQGLMGRSREGRTLFFQLLVAFLPAVIAGLLGAKWIKANLFGVWQVAFALAAGGLLMIGVESWRARGIRKEGGSNAIGLPLSSMTVRAALIIGLAQCLAMWPGTSRSMITMVAALLLGFSPVAAAEFSFLLALPTLGAATLHDVVKEGGAILDVSGMVGLALGFAVSFIAAWLAVRAFLSYLTRHGMAVFGWYRIALAILVVVFS
jgi:undecaprenyl-diphosphatase